MPAAQDVLDRIRISLKRQGVSQAELAKRLGVSGAVVSKWLNGRRSPNVDRLAEIVSILGLSWGEFFGLPPITGPYLSPVLEEVAALSRKVEELEERIESVEA